MFSFSTVRKSTPSDKSQGYDHAVPLGRRLPHWREERTTIIRRNVVHEQYNQLEYNNWPSNSHHYYTINPCQAGKLFCASRMARIIWKQSFYSSFNTGKDDMGKVDYIFFEFFRPDIWKKTFQLSMPKKISHIYALVYWFEPLADRYVLWKRKLLRNL
ncbi:hypothetical protein VU04_01940 [Desulfobulbus sp. TB]|nr:hypothetical protein [Desulfobulbus sp. TB]